MLGNGWDASWANGYVIAGVLAGALSLFAYVPYIRDTMARRTQPDRATWAIWAVLASLSGASNVYEGAGASLAFIAVQVAGTLIVFGLSLTRGRGSYLGSSTLLVFFAAGAGLIAWYLTETAFYALCISIGISALGGASTIWKSFRNPQSETLSTWIISSIAAALGVLSVGINDPLLLAYPGYLLLLYSTIVAAMTLGRLTGQEPYEETFVWSTRRPTTRLMPPVVSPPFVLGPATSTTPAVFAGDAATAGIETDIR